MVCYEVELLAFKKLSIWYLNVCIYCVIMLYYSLDLSEGDL